MAVRYTELLQKVVRPRGFDEVGRLKMEGMETATIACQAEPIIIPFAFPNYPIQLEDGDNSEIDDEVVAALKRWMSRQRR